MLATVLKEMENIPKIKNNLPQNLFRGYYYWLRMNSLKESKGNKSDIFKRALGMIKKDYPEFKPMANYDFFKE